MVFLCETGDSKVSAMLDTKDVLYVQMADDSEDEMPLPLEGDFSKHDTPWSFRKMLSVMGPGIMVCLADTDGPCLLTAATSGTDYKYSLVLVQIILIPVLYSAQELTVRLACVTKDGITGLISKHFGKFWAWLACTLHVTMCLQGQLSEFGSISMLASQIWGIEPWIATVIQLSFLTAVMLLGVFRAVEFIGVALGSLQIVFIAVMFMIKPDWGEVWDGLWTFHWGDQNWEMLVAGNVGAVIMPWMLYYQQSAICTRKIKVKDMKYERVDTLIGSILAQTVMLSMVIAMGATQFVGKDAEDRNYGAVRQAFAPYLGSMTELVVSCGSLGACMVASIVLMITPAWSIAEIIGVERDIDKGVRKAPIFYLLQFLGLLICAVTTIFSDFATTPAFAVFTEVTNGLLILPVATFLWLLASSPKVLPEKFRLKGWYKWTIFVVFFIVCMWCVYGAYVSVVLAWQA
eukprot:gnl/MRDRNA2_/MRDRNA2_142856_c0_seq1.p1 gnl/MRDRNA2_/MRDRNA2_142856_c0~~gnl/MRDRNA2_/MRDRNA2_142856_c0_seq1.p1  ORF type:complete len:460 (+),score=63.84 gnl/MRDRNA2_/MRDRNA2_142856_c0_seq1:149-1528(+)